MNAVRKSFAFIFLILCIVGLAACSKREVGVPPSPLALTLTVQAIQLQWLAQTEQAQQSQPIVIVVTATPDPNSLAPTVNPAANTAPAATTSNTVTVTVSQNTNCRSGPSVEFNEVGALNPGQIAEVVGKDTFDNYWIVKLPDSPGKTCWLWGQYATVTGDASMVADVATPTAVSNGTPDVPALLDAQVKCTNLGGGNYQYKMLLKWADNSTNENKFVIYTSNSSQFSASPNKTSFSFEENLPSGSSLYATLVAANEKGESNPVQTNNFTCP